MSFATILTSCSHQAKHAGTTVVYVHYKLALLLSLTTIVLLEAHSNKSHSHHAYSLSPFPSLSKTLSDQPFSCLYSPAASRLLALARQASRIPHQPLVRATRLQSKQGKRYPNFLQAASEYSTRMIQHSYSMPAVEHAPILRQSLTCEQQRAGKQANSKQAARVSQTALIYIVQSVHILQATLSMYSIYSRTHIYTHTYKLQ